MKIIKENKAFIQVCDINQLPVFFLTDDGKKVPFEIRQRIVANLLKHCSKDQYYFVEFNDPMDIDFIKTLQFIADYSEILNANEVDMEKMAQNIGDEINNLGSAYLEADEDKETIDLALSLAIYKNRSYQEAYSYKYKALYFKLPKESLQNKLKLKFKKL
ncbi:MAG: hypothetical protein R3Y21_02380 [Mycoplasmatota bacterium]